MTDLQRTLESGLRAAARGELPTWTLGRVRALQAAVEAASDRDFRHAGESILLAALDALVLFRARPSCRQRLEKVASLAAPASPPLPEPDGIGGREPIRPRRRRYSER